MARSSDKRYRSYSEKKSQTIKFRLYFVRIFLLLIIYSLFTSFVAITIKVNSDSMAPTLANGNSLIFIPSKNLNSIIKKNSNYRRGEIVISGTNYIVEATLLDKILDPIVRVFTLQKKTLLYDNTNYKGRGELLRVVGLPGDTIKIKDNTIYIKPEGEDFFLNEFELTEVNYDISKKEFSKLWKEEFPFSSKLDEVYITEDNYFLVCDNRGIMNDSRVYGVVNKNLIKGKVLLKYWPMNEFIFY